MSIEERCRREIEELHQFFARWFNAEVEDSSEQFERVASVIADGFVLIDLEGNEVPRDEILSVIRERWGHHEDGMGGIEIQTEDVGLIRSEPPLHLATYIEIQRTAEVSNRRRSSVLFRDESDAPNGLEWLYVQETPRP